MFGLLKRLPEGWRGASFLFAVSVIFMRRPDALLNAQFFAEDGAVWFEHAHNFGWWTALWIPHAGYLHLAPRLAAAFAVLVPLVRAPLVMNGIAIAIQALPILILLSPRCERWGTIRFRVGLSLLYLVLPNTRELMASVTESQWILALCAFLLVFAKEPGKRGVLVNILFLAACSLTGPFCILLLPFAALRFWQERDGWRGMMFLVFIASSIVQAAVLLTHEAGRTGGPLGASVAGLIRLLAGQVFIGATLGGNSMATSLSLPAATWITALGCTLLASCLISSEEMRSLVLFACLVLATTLAKPLAGTASISAWTILATARGTHYWFLPSLAVAWAAADCLRRGPIAQVGGGLVLLMMSVGVVRDFRYPPLPDLHFADYARDALPVSIPENPAGWQLRLLDHP